LYSYIRINLLTCIVISGRVKPIKRLTSILLFFGSGSGLLRIVFGKMGVLPKVYRTRPEQHPNKTVSSEEDDEKEEHSLTD